MSDCSLTARQRIDGTLCRSMNCEKCKKVREDKTQAIIDYHLEEMGKSDKPPSFYLNFKHKIEQKDARIKELEEREKKLIECLGFYRRWSSVGPIAERFISQTLKELGIKDKE